LSSSKLKPKYSLPKQPRPRSSGPEHELIELRWLVRWGLISVGVAALCGYLALCLLFYQGQWQLVLHPAPLQAVPKGALPPYQEVHFAATEQGVPQLDGWWIPADVESEFASDTLVFFPDGNGSLSDRLQWLTDLHRLGINILAMEYRGFGNSARIRPNQRTMEDDALDTLTYLTGLRHVPPSHIVVYAEGLGAKPALFATNQQPNICCVILSNPRMSQRSVFDADTRTHLLPLRWLLRDDFSLQPEISQTSVPKLIVTTIATQTAEADARSVFAAAHDPKAFLKLPPTSGTAQLGEYLRNTLRPPSR
jgi:pimeloyl-ACP methyl ester carboxylesterase